MEVLVSAFIMAVIMAGLANIFLAGKRHIVHSRTRTSGSELGRYFLDPLQMQVRQDRWGNNCLSTGNCPDQTLGITQGLDRDYTAHYTVINNSPANNLNKVEVEISWSEE